VKYAILSVLVVALSGLALCACQHGPTGVVDKVLVDFGVRPQPEGYVSGADRVFEKLGLIGEAELKRLNQDTRQGEVKFEEEKGIHAKYYKQTKVYEDAHPLDAQATAHSATSEGGYVGYIEYSYRIYQSARKSKRVEAEAETATVATDETGREVYRYEFNQGGDWNGGQGKRVKR